MVQIPRAKMEEYLNSRLYPEDNSTISPPLTASSCRILLERLGNFPIYAHTYAFFFHFKYGILSPKDLIDYAHGNGLRGCALHVHDGGKSSLAQMRKKQRQQFGRYATFHNIRLSLETSHTDRAHIDELVSIALDTGCRDARVYSRYQGHLSQILKTIGEDMKYMAEMADRHDMAFYFEQHEDLKALELASLIAENGHPHLGLLYDFTNMLNAYEMPLNALRDMAPYIRQVHVKGGRRVVEAKGWGQKGVLFCSAEDELPAERMLYELLMLGEKKPQVKAFIMEQEVGYYAPPFRWPTQEQDPFIPHRDPSETMVPASQDPVQICQDEKQHAGDMIRQLRKILDQLESLAKQILTEDEPENTPFQGERSSKR